VFRIKSWGYDLRRCVLCPCRPDISIVMITMNEEKAVGKVIGDIQRLLPAAEIVIVDSSRDATPEIAAALGATVIRQFPPKGYGRAMDLSIFIPYRERIGQSTMQPMRSAYWTAKRILGARFS
jgi:Glycosyl transferase family 2